MGNLCFQKIFVLILVGCVVGKNTKDVGDSCETNTGDSGTCTFWEHCDSRVLSEGPEPAICDWQGDELIICCPKTAVTKEPVFTKARQKCEEYTKNKSLGATRTIHGGEDVVSVYKYPHMALLGYDLETGTEWACGGTLISERFVLTASHCLNYNRVRVSRIQFGLLDKRDRNASGTLQEYKVLKFHSHPDRNPREQYHDIALLELEKPVKFTNATYPACLHSDYDIKSVRATAIGWGKLEFDGMVADILQRVSLKLNTEEECALHYSPMEKLPRGLDYTSQFCAGESGEDACKGDSGGPLQILDTSGMANIIGVISFGFYCGIAPGVYTRVSYYVPWIESIVWP